MGEADFRGNKNCSVLHMLAGDIKWAVRYTSLSSGKRSGPNTNLAVFKHINSISSINFQILKLKKIFHVSHPH